MVRAAQVSTYTAIQQKHPKDKRRKICLKVQPRGQDYNAMPASVTRATASCVVGVPSRRQGRGEKEPARIWDITHTRSQLAGRTLRLKCAVCLKSRAGPSPVSPGSECRGREEFPLPGGVCHPFPSGPPCADPQACRAREGGADAGLAGWGGCRRGGGGRDALEQKGEKERAAIPLLRARQALAGARLCGLRPRNHSPGPLLPHGRPPAASRGDERSAERSPSLPVASLEPGGAGRAPCPSLPIPAPPRPLQSRRAAAPPGDSSTGPQALPSSGRGAPGHLGPPFGACAGPQPEPDAGRGRAGPAATQEREARLERGRREREGPPAYSRSGRELNPALHTDVPVNHRNHPSLVSERPTGGMEGPAPLSSPQPPPPPAYPGSQPAWLNPQAAEPSID
ncbi:basic proline-rich protein-like [Lemur catta]|uniref:basic proline-rich protein-like n=1 Tax=Lemur catta TaxID=9447 RepID=UPI001E26A196|nr:basic proline-rich protein-like [Lemur catta]